MPPNDAEVRAALGRLQEAPAPPWRGGQKWLDAHREGTITVVQAKGVATTAQLIGISLHIFYAWKQSRLIEWTTPPRKDKRTPPPEPPEVDTEGVAYWKAKAEAYQEILQQLLSWAKEE